MKHTVEIDLGGRTLSLETGKVARQADGAVVVRMGDTVVLVTACSSSRPKTGISFFPLTVDYREATYSAGRFPGGFIKREGRPTEREVLTCRMIDRPLRPLFPAGYSCETQIIGMVLSSDPEVNPSPLAIAGAGAALALSDIPFEHTLAAVTVASIDGRLIANPSHAELRESKLNIVVAASDDGIVMVEAGATLASEAQVLAAIEFGHENCKKITAGIRELVAKAGKPKRAHTPPVLNQEAYDKISKEFRAPLTDALDTAKKKVDALKTAWDKAKAAADAAWAGPMWSRRSSNPFLLTTGPAPGSLPAPPQTASAAECEATERWPRLVSRPILGRSPMGQGTRQRAADLRLCGRSVPIHGLYQRCHIAPGVFDVAVSGAVKQPLERRSAGRLGPIHAWNGGGPSGIRTHDTRIKSPLLCR